MRNTVRNRLRFLAFTIVAAITLPLVAGLTAAYLMWWMGFDKAATLTAFGATVSFTFIAVMTVATLITSVGHARDRHGDSQ
jgi:hypothetical protein